MASLTEKKKIVTCDNSQFLVL